MSAPAMATPQKKGTLGPRLHKERKVEQEEEELSQGEKNFTCIICFEALGLDKETSLNCCDHKYCFACISKWVSDEENSCPQCKRSITKLKYMDQNGQCVEKEVTRRSQQEIFANCYRCIGSLNVADLVPFPSAQTLAAAQGNPNTSVYCNSCRIELVHLRCMTPEERQRFNDSSDFVWRCRACTNYQSMSSSGRPFEVHRLRAPYGYRSNFSVRSNAGAVPFHVIELPSLQSIRRGPTRIEISFGGSSRSGIEIGTRLQPSTSSNSGS